MVKIYDIGINHTSYKINVKGRRILMVELKAINCKIESHKYLLVIGIYDF